MTQKQAGYEFGGRPIACTNANPGVTLLPLADRSTGLESHP